MTCRLTNSQSNRASPKASPVRVSHSGGSQTTVQRILRKAHNGLFRAEFIPSSSGSPPGDASESANRLAGVDDFNVHEDAL